MIQRDEIEGVWDESWRGIGRGASERRAGMTDDPKGREFSH